MGQVYLLDCTLRDGGYINDWRFGKDAIDDMIAKLERTNVDILELGFFKNEPYQPDRTVFNDAKQISALLAQKKENMRYAMMIEVVNPLPLEQMEEASKTSVDIIRVIVWKRMLKEGFEYCKGIVEKGYRLCVQPARVDQYSDDEFVEMVRMFNQLDPLAIYVVDSWGTQTSESLQHYMKLADENLKDGIALGYHGHNNLMQAYQVAVDFIQIGFDRDIIVDASVYGIGRGAGNLNLELIARYMNAKLGKDYEIEPMIEVYSKYLQDIYNECPWGFSMPHYITAIHNCNPNFGAYYDREKKLPSVEIDKIISSIPPEDRIIYTDEKAEQYMRQYFNEN